VAVEARDLVFPGVDLVIEGDLARGTGPAGSLLAGGRDGGRLRTGLVGTEGGGQRNPDERQLDPACAAG